MTSERNRKTPGEGPREGRRIPRSRRRKNIEFVEHLSGEEQMLLAFPWSRNLTPPERAEFAEALAHHPSSFSNAQLEALIVSWKHRAERATRSRAA